MLLLDMPRRIIHPGEWALIATMTVTAAVDGAIVSRKNLMRAKVTPQVS